MRPFKIGSCQLVVSFISL